MGNGRRVIVSMRGIVKRFPGVVANDHIDLDIYEGEVLALLGENGAGKTTLMNILYGLYTPDEGEIYINGRRVVHRSPRDAIKNGIGMVHQHFTLVEDLTIAENVVLGLEELGLLVDVKKVAREIIPIINELGFKLDPLQKIWQLSAGEKQKVEILKALYRKVKVLILDEPTSVLTPQDVKELFKTIRKLVSKGISVVFISHKLHEVMEIADRIVVLRKGRVVGRLKREEANPRLLAKLMVGREVFLEINKPPANVGKVVLEVKDLKALSDKGVLALKGVSFRIREGEILGVAGVAGNGQKELAEVLY
ncbi:MAG TPA: ATP-binding cassette domain-containing protein, partial [Acidilobales archaeon]|nr:ATP-binding cassette domain-containing protein [Acidilobales archaeon]